MGRGMEMDGCGRFVQILLFVANFFIWMGSIAILVFGIWAVVDRPYLELVLGESIYMSAAYILIGVGVLTFIISFLGCFGALKEIKCMLLMYFIIVLLLFIILLIGGILGFVFHGQAEDKLKMEMRKSLKGYKVDTTLPVTVGWDDTQKAMKCCGIDNYEDWAAINGDFVNNPGRKKVPTSCCKVNNEGVPSSCQAIPRDDNAYTEGCFIMARDFVKEHAKYIGAAGIVVAVLMLFGLVFSIILFKLIN